MAHEGRLSRVWHIGQLVHCMFCVSPLPSMTFKITCKGGAMLSCRACGSRAFLHGAGTHGPESLFGAMTLALLDDNVDAARKIHEGAAVKGNSNVPTG